VNPIVRRLLERGLWRRAQALLETTGRSDRVAAAGAGGNGLRGESFWIVTEHGYAADYVKNIQKFDTSGRERSRVVGVLALRPERSAQVRMPPTAPRASRGERPGPTGF